MIIYIVDLYELSIPILKWSNSNIFTQNTGKYNLGNRTTSVVAGY